MRSNDAAPSEPLTEEDRRLINALQVAPRATWKTVGAVLGRDPVTVARRWRRLTGSGLAWVVSYRTTLRLAIVEIDCPPGSTDTIAAALMQDPETATIDLTIGGRDIVATVASLDEDSLAEYIVRDMSALDTMKATRTHLVTQVVRDARSWELRELSADEATALIEASAPRPPHRPANLTPTERDAVVGALIRNGRAGPVDIATMSGISTDRARAALYELLTSGDVTIRTEVARRYSGSPAYAWFFLRASARSMDTAIARLSTLRDLRLLTRTVGTHNIVMAMWLRSSADIHRVEAVIERTAPDLTIDDRSLVIRTPKHLGWSLTEDGRNAGERQ
ncbi:MAG: Lrp/AsnC family transcriptional regulator [Gordonia sp. (in: high G+C Gram-positive bacteria)]